jgi:hypothetical protein
MLIVNKIVGPLEFEQLTYTEIIKIASMYIYQKEVEVELMEQSTKAGKK